MKIDQTLIDQVFEKIDRSEYKWHLTPSELTEPEFVDCYQYQLTILNSQSFGKNSAQPKFHQIDQRIRISNILLGQRSEKPLFDQLRQQVGLPNNPFGKIAIWKILPNGRANDHRDQWPYHYLINRYIFNLNMKNEHCHLKVNDNKINCSPGEICQIDCLDWHKIVNDQNETVYFFQIDIFKHINISQESYYEFYSP
jgi:hypothetical protein